MPQPQLTLTRPPGFYDRTAQEAAEAADTAARLQAALARFGYQIIETPLIEYADLFLTKSGDEAVNRLFTFELYGRLLCLRSEFTPSAARLYVERWQHEPKPIRWQFAGPVFRYEAPGRGQSRQFTMIGTELIGPSGRGGDAETIALAAQGLRALGLGEYTITIGHVGLVGLLLDRFGLDRRLRRYVLGQVENLRRADRGRPYVEQQLEQLYSGLSPVLEKLDEAQALLELSSDEPDAPDKLGDALQLLLESANLGSSGAGRTNEDIARRLLTKQRRAAQRPAIGQALDFLEALAGISGSPAQAFPALAALVADQHDTRTQAALTDFRAAVDLLAAYGLLDDQIRVDMGFVRGLNYYTGIVFEIAAPDGAALGGGGRYDDFIRVLGAAQDTPAIGFAYRLERILAELRRVGRETGAASAVQALVVPLDEGDDAEAARVAMALRAQTGANVELYTPPTRNLSQVLARTGKRGTPLVVIVGAEERADGQVSLRDMRAGSQTRCTVAEVVETIKSL